MRSHNFLQQQSESYKYRESYDFFEREQSMTQSPRRGVTG